MTDGEKYKRRVVSLDTLRANQKKKNTLHWIFYIFIFLVICGVFAAVCFGLLFKVKSIELVGLTHYTNEAVSEHLIFTIDDNLYSFNSEQAEKKLKTELPYIAEVSVKRRLPSTVVVELVEKEPVMYVEIVDKFYLLSEELHVLETAVQEPAGNGNLIKLTTEKVDRCIVGEQMNFSDTFTLNSYNDLIGALSEQNMLDSIKSIDMLTRFNITLNYEDRIQVYIGDTVDINMKMRFLKGIIAKLNEDERGYLDLTSVKEASFRPES